MGSPMRLVPDLIGPVLHDHRNRLRLSQGEAARRAGVSTRLWAETERGQRPHVSATSLLRMLEAVEVAVHTVARPEHPAGAPSPSHPPLSPAVEAELREDLRRAREYGVDISLIRAGLDLTPLEHVRRNDEALEFFGSITLEPGWPPTPEASSAPRPTHRRAR